MWRVIDGSRGGGGTAGRVSEWSTRHKEKEGLMFNV